MWGEMGLGKTQEPLRAEERVEGGGHHQSL